MGKTKIKCHVWMVHCIENHSHGLSSTFILAKLLNKSQSTYSIICFWLSTHVYYVGYIAKAPQGIIVSQQSILLRIYGQIIPNDWSSIVVGNCLIIGINLNLDILLVQLKCVALPSLVPWHLNLFQIAFHKVQ